LFKNTILNTTNEDGQHNLWLSINVDVRKMIKDGLLASLASSCEANIKNAALCLAVIASVELD
jgi:hypothetical protein